MISKILIANRGEIACRVIQTAKAMGIKTVAVYSTADKNALHVSMADEAVCLGPAPSSESYLRGDIIIEKANILGVDAIHPGYGFLSENAEFAALCENNNIIFIGPPTSAITAMGSKSKAKELMQDAGVPLVPGFHGEQQEPSFLQAQANDIGYPVLLKASAGGGGKGMRTVHSDSEFSEALAAAKRESMKSFGDEHMLIEKYLTQPRHVEIQVFCDNHGNAVHLFERDCSVQRRHQKIIEEAPAPNFPSETRALMGETAKKAALAIGYRGAGTVEFLYDSDGKFYFMEMNTRLQVEHPVTECITGLDLVKWQIDIANGKPLPVSQDALSFSGHAIEARIYAEDPDNAFLPSTGRLDVVDLPSGSPSHSPSHAWSYNDGYIRVDTGIKSGDKVSVYYDPMIAKLIAYGEDRHTALAKLDTALQEFRLGPVKTNINYLLKVIRSPAFINADLTTNFIDQQRESLNAPQAVSDAEYLAAFVLASGMANGAFSTKHVKQNDSSVFYRANNFRVNLHHSKEVGLIFNDTKIVAHVSHLAQNTLDINVNGNAQKVMFEREDDVLLITGNDLTHRFAYHINDEAIFIYGNNGRITFELCLPDLGDHDHSDYSDEITAPMNGVIVDVLVAAGDVVAKDQTLVIIEAMKMEQSIKSPRDGVVESCFFNAGDKIDGGATLLALKENTEENA